MAGVGDLWIWGRGQIMKGSVDGLWEVCGSMRRSWEDLWEDLGGLWEDPGRGAQGRICWRSVDLWGGGSWKALWEDCGRSVELWVFRDASSSHFSLQPFCRLVSGEPGKRRPGMVWMELAAITVFLRPLIS